MTENPWQLWKETVEAKAPPQLPERIRKMLMLHGKTEGKTCKTCKHLYRRGYSSKVYLKCLHTKTTRGPATDWRAGWPACGLFEEGETKKVQEPKT